MKKILSIEIIALGLIVSYFFIHFSQPFVNEEKNIKPTEVVEVEEIPQATFKVKENKLETVILEQTDPALPQEEAAVEAMKNEKPEEEENALAGKIISIDAGHQSYGNSERESIGPGSTETKAKVSSGTKGVATGKYEYALNLEVALKLKVALEAKGAEVYMVRETNDVDISNMERAQLANDVNADLSLRIHADGSENSSINGFSVLVPGGNFVSDVVISESYAVAEYMNDYLSEGIPNVSRGIITREDLTGFNWSKVPAVLVEMGFMSNPEEDQRMSTEDFQNDFVEALIKALEAYYDQY